MGEKTLGAGRDRSSRGLLLDRLVEDHASSDGRVTLLGLNEVKIVANQTSLTNDCGEASALMMFNIWRCL